MRNVHWLHALAIATSIVSFGPRSRSDAKSTAYETDIVDPLRASGRLTLKTEVSEERNRSARKSHGSENVLNGRSTASSTAPTTMTVQTTIRAAIGRDFIESLPYFPLPRPGWAPFRGGGPGSSRRSGQPISSQPEASGLQLRLQSPERPAAGDGVQIAPQNRPASAQVAAQIAPTQSSPPHALPQTTLTSPARSPQTPSSQPSPVQTVPQTASSPLRTPETTLSPRFAVGVPHITSARQYGESGLSTPPVIRWLPQMICRLHRVGSASFAGAEPPLAK